MTIGPASMLALISAVLATLIYWLARRINLADWLCLGLFGFVLVLVATAGPLVRLP